MTQTVTLSSIFDKTKGELESSLYGLTLPKDSTRVQEIITNYLNNVCDENSDYRQNLTQSEDYILQAALSMLNAQRDLVSAFNCTPDIETRPADIEPTINEATTVLHGSAGVGVSALRSANGYSMIGAGGGALVGKLILGGWGAVFGAIAGTAVALYLSQQSQSTAPQSKRIPSKNTVTPVKVCDSPVNTELLLNVIRQICESLDNLIATFRAQIQRVVNKYETQEKPTIEREYRVLLEGIQSLIGYKRGHNPEDEKYLSKLQTRVEDLAELLDNYDLEAVDYTPDHSDWFEAVESKNATEIKMVNPAILKKGQIVLKGKIFIPTK